jgi:rhamnosyltransferase
MNDICAVVVSYNGGDMVRRCVDSVRNQVDEVIIADNGSDQVTLGELRRLQSQGNCEVLLNGRNLGIAGALNRGVQYAIGKGYRWVLTLDDDSEASPDMVARLVAGFESSGPDVGIVAANPLDLNLRALGLAVVPENPSAVPIKVRTAISSGCLIDVRVFAKTGFFDEQLFLAYVDHDFCVRAGRDGFQILQCPDAVLLHREGSKEVRNLLWKRVCYNRYGKEARYFITRNAIHVLRRYPQAGFSREIALRWLADLIKIIVYDKERVSKTAFIFKGLIDGVRGKYGGLERPITRPRAALHGRPERSDSGCQTSARRKVGGCLASVPQISPFGCCGCNRHDPGGQGKEKFLRPKKEVRGAVSLKRAVKRIAGRRGRLLARRLRTRRWPIAETYQEYLRGRWALEIGGPTDCLGYAGPFPIYSCLEGIDGCNYAPQTLWHSEAVKYRRTLICEGTELPVGDASYDCVIASHCLEHIANPIKALLEWRRVLRRGGLLLLILPHKEYTFDWRRSATTIEHMRHDFEHNTPETDLSHLDEVLGLHDLSRDPPAGTPEQFKARCARNAEVRAIHHHVFVPETATQLLTEVGFSMVRQDVEESNIITLGKKS